MKQYQTKTGIRLTVIQGDGLGTGIATGQLRLVQDETIEKLFQYDTRRYAAKLEKTKPASLIETVLIWLYKIGA